MTHQFQDQTARRERAKTGVALALLATAGVGLWSVLVPWPPPVDAARHQAAGWGLAQVALGLRGDGGQVVVMTRDTTEFPQPAMDRVMKGLRSGLKEGQVTLERVREVEVDPLRLVELPSGDFMSLVRALPSGSVLISLLGPPFLTEDQRRQVGARPARVVAYCPGSIPDQVDLRRLFDQGVLEVAVVSRGAGGEVSGGGVQGRFKAWFETVTVSNVGALYAERPWAREGGRQ